MHTEYNEGIYRMEGYYWMHKKYTRSEYLAS